MTRPLALLVVALWLGTLVSSWVVATLNFRTVDRVLGAGRRPELAERLSPLAAGDDRVALRHLASEVNRSLFGLWTIAQLGLGTMAVVLLLRTSGAARALAAASLAIVLVEGLALGPQIRDLGRSIDFLPRPLPAETGRRFGLLHAAYVGLDLLKAALLAGAAGALVRGLR